MRTYEFAFLSTKYNWHIMKTSHVCLCIICKVNAYDISILAKGLCRSPSVLQYLHEVFTYDIYNHCSHGDTFMNAFRHDKIVQLSNAIYRERERERERSALLNIL